MDGPQHLAGVLLWTSLTLVTLAGAILANVAGPEWAWTVPAIVSVPALAAAVNWILDDLDQS